MKHFMSCIGTISLTSLGVSIKQVFDAIVQCVIASTADKYGCCDMGGGNALVFIGVGGFLADYPASSRG